MVPAWVGGAIEEVASNSHHLIFPSTALYCNCIVLHCSEVQLHSSEVSWTTMWLFCNVGKNSRVKRSTSASIFLRPGKASEWRGLVQAARPYTCASVDGDAQKENIADPIRPPTRQPTITKQNYKNFLSPRSWAFPALGLNCKLFQTLRLPSSQGHPAFDKE